MKRWFLYILICLPALSGLAACAAGAYPAPDGSSGIYPTPIPAYVATEQAAAIQARSTRQAGEGRLVELAAESTTVVLQMTASAATEIHLARQTQQAQIATADAIQAASQARTTAQAAAYTAVALEAAGTATQAAYQVQGTSTSIALGLLQASATAEVERIAEQRQSERQTLLFRTWAGRIALVILFSLSLFIAWQSASWVLLRFFGVYRLVNRPVVITPNGRGGFNVFDISRSMHPGASVSQAGQIETAGGAADVHIQSQVAARAQAGELLLAANSGQALKTGQRRSILMRALQTGAPIAPTLPAPLEAQAEVIIIPPDDPRVRPLLDEVEPKLLNAGDQL